MNQAYSGYQLSNIFLASDAVSRSITAENPRGEKGRGGMEVPAPDHAASDLGKGWKVKPCINLKAGETVTIAEIEGPGLITHIWTTCHIESFRDCILRFYWDDETEPSVEVPYGDFFCNGWDEKANVFSLPINVNPDGGFNSYWPMPFRKSAKITIENQRKDDIWGFFYQIDYLLTDIPKDSMYFHAQWRRSNPVPYQEEHTIIDNLKGKGKFAGVYMAWGQNNNGWWGEGEVKFYIDGDTDYPTINGTGTEDYFGGAWCFHNKDATGYETFSAPYLGYHQLIKPDGYLKANLRHGLYRWHVQDPVFFQSDFKATVQALGWRKKEAEQMKYLPLQDDIASTAFWYQLEPHQSFPELPEKKYREVI